MNLILLGKPGAGKGTQASLLAQRFNLQHFSTGALFRRHLKENTDLGKKIQSFMHSPNLIHDEIVNEVVNEECERLYHSNIIFDGYPRTIDQARHLDSYLRNPIDYIFFLAVSDNTALERVAKRQQENPRSENNSEERRIGRLKEYETLTIPVVRYYLNAGKLTTIGGEGKISGISKKLVSIMEKEKQ